MDSLNVSELIKIGVFPGAVIQNDFIVLASIEQDAPAIENETPIISEITPKTDLNTASEQELSDLPGVGVALAKRTVEIRMQIGGFTNADSNLSVS